MQYNRRSRTAGKSVSHMNRGAILEKLLDMTHVQYKNTGVADIKKIPTPVKILRIIGAKVEGHLEAGEFTDYMGMSQGRTLLFDAKETKEKRLPLKNIHAHQYKLLESWTKHGAIAFLIVAFTSKNDEIYLLSFEQLREFWEAAKLPKGRQSIPQAFFAENCPRVTSENGIVLHYLKHVHG